MTERLLPEPFADLAPFVAEWSLASEEARFRKRVASSLETLEQFHAATFPRLEAAMNYLDTLKIDEPDALEPPARRLYDLALMVMEAAQPIDLDWRGADLEDCFPLDRFVFLPPGAA
ncbi:MAG: hypothetical protein JWL84_6267 [Rhodospirillales bacterium]|jgi:hypothetical protein|nr:hypothetical protein [Rhodospirillales bacterium]